jgi:hypothetical protein
VGCTTASACSAWPASRRRSRAITATRGHRSAASAIRTTAAWTPYSGSCNCVFDSAQGGLVGFAQGDAQRRDVEDYLFAFDADLAPIVGQQITLDEHNAATVAPRIDLLRARARTPFASRLTGGQATECDLVVTGVIDGRAVRFVMAADGRYRRDNGAQELSDDSLRARARIP